MVASGCRLRGKSSRRPSTTSGRPRQPARTAAQGSGEWQAENGELQMSCGHMLLR